MSIVAFTATKPTVFNKIGRIVNGFDTGKALPYQLGLRNGIFACGGTMISAKYGITADHCINTGYLMENTIVTAGAYKTSDAWSSSSQDQV